MNWNAFKEAFKASVARSASSPIEAVNQFVSQRKGQMGGGVLGKVITIVAVPMLIIIGLIVYAEFNSSVDTSDLSTDAQDAINATNSNAYAGFNLAGVLPIVIAGVAVLGIVIGAFAYMRQ